MGGGGVATAMAGYALGLTPLLDHVKHVVFPDDLTGAGRLKEIKI